MFQCYSIYEYCPEQQKYIPFMHSGAMVVKKSDREISRVQRYIYTLALASFLVSFPEGFRESTPYNLIIHFCASLALLCLVPGSFRRPVLTLSACLIILVVVWGGFLLSAETYGTWVFFKAVCLLLFVPAYRTAFRARAMIKRARSEKESH
ncbi:MAG TPA: hypothetical protein VKZ68_09055 [Ohtaekwangia sp.]|nr:hypothetical protein [Ohtaekwangia sp.]